MKPVSTQTDLCLDRIAPALRLEQERIGYTWIESALAAFDAVDASQPGRI